MRITGQVIPCDIRSEFIRRGARRIESYLDSTGRMFQIDGHVVGRHTAILEPLNRFSSEVILADRAFDDGMHTESCGMASKIGRRATKDARILEEIPKDFAKSYDGLFGG